MDRLDMVFTPRRGGWLNIVESELSVLTRQSLDDRLASEMAVYQTRHSLEHTRQHRTNRNRLAPHQSILRPDAAESHADFKSI